MRTLPENHPIKANVTHKLLHFVDKQTLYLFFFPFFLKKQMSIVEIVELKHRRSQFSLDNTIESGFVLKDDPLSLEKQKVTDDYILKTLKGQKSLQNFYKSQNELIDSMLTALDKNTQREEETRQLLKVKSEYE